MKSIFIRIAERAEEHAKRPIFLFMRDADRNPRDRLKFVPYLSHFVMTFSDLYRFVLPEYPARDRYQELVNVHLAEEDTHWGWYLADLTNLELDPRIRFTDALRFLWSDRMVKSRMLAYEMCRLGIGASSLRKLVLVQAIEATGRVALESLTVAGVAFAGSSQKKIVYFGRRHLETETKHTVESDSVRQWLEDIVLDEPTRVEMLAVVDEVFRHFTVFADEAFQFAEHGTDGFAASSARADRTADRR
jgi:hypothetical protein